MMMGELETARRQHQAPWPDATEQEDRDYDQGVQLGDSEFETEVAEASAPQVHPYIDADRANYVDMYIGSKNARLEGFFVPKAFETDEDFREASIERYGKVMQQADETLEADKVYAAGARNARPELWAHEFMHRQHVEEDVQYWAQSEEVGVRKIQAFRASTPDQWLQSVELWRSYLMNRRDAPDSMSLSKAEEHLKRTLDSVSDQYIKREAEYNENKGNRPRSRNWAIDTHTADAREALEHRQKSWNIEDSVRHKQMLVERAARAKKRDEFDKALTELDESIGRLKKKIGQE